MTSLFQPRPPFAPGARLARIGRRAAPLAASVLLAVLTACGGGGGSGNGSGQPDTGTTPPPAKSTDPVTHRVGGTVSGLAGKGFVLQNNAGDDLAVAADGSFVFATALAEGASYGVTVKTQPSDATQVCTVNAGSGTVGSADVGNVAVTCSTSSFAVGGSVSQLQGSGLVIQNNGGDDIAVAADGSFRFDTAVASGANYLVSVKTQPSSPTQTCSVSQGSGKVLAAAIDGVAIVCSTDAFAVGGSVSGLQGSGLVLTNNDGDALPVSGSSFTFPAAVASGSDYTVKVSQQPSNPSQSCAVTNAHGTMGSGAVNTVSVTCSVNSFFVKLKVSGLDGVGLVLQNNDGDDITVTGDGDYTFGAQVPSGVDYKVSVLTQPSLVTQNCTVDKATGTIGGADVSDVTVACVSQIPHFAFLAAQGASATGKVLPFGIDTLGQLSPLDASFAAVADALPTSIAADAAGQHVYVGTASGISQFDVAANGAVTPMTTPKVAAGTAPMSLTLDPKGRFAYVLNVTQNKVTTLPIGAGGALGAAKANSVGGVGLPIAFTLESSGRFVYVANSGSRVSAFAVDATNGSLTAVGTPINLGLRAVLNLVADASGRFVYVLSLDPIRGTYAVNGYTIQSNGSLVSMGAGMAVTGAPTGFVAHPAGKVVYLTLANGAIRTFAIKQDAPDTGTLSVVAGSDTAALGTPILRAAVDAAGRFLYASTGAGVVAYPVDHATGVLGAGTALTVPSTAITSMALGL